MDTFDELVELTGTYQLTIAAKSAQSGTIRGEMWHSCTAVISDEETKITACGFSRIDRDDAIRIAIHKLARKAYALKSVE